MIAAGVLLLTVGLADLARQFLGSRSRRSRIAAALATVVIVCGLATGVLPWPLAALTAVLAAAWMALMPSTNTAAVAGFWPAVGLALVVLALVVSAPDAAHGWASGWWVAVTADEALPLTRIALLVGTVAFLLESANIVVRIALQSERGDTTPASVAPTRPVPARSSPWRRFVDGIRRPVALEPPAATKQLRGGRLIGPLERLFVVGLISTSAVALLAAFIAAKGIVRFPEIQKDNAGGTQAEYFLVGSMASWAIALAAAGLLWAVGATPSGLGNS